MPDADPHLAARAVIWDLDGTLADSEESHWLAWRQVMEEEGIAITRGQFLATFGQRNDTVLAGWLGMHANEPQVDRIGAAKEAAFRRLVRTRGCVSLPGALDWVQRLGRRGWRQAIASSAPRANIGVMLKALGIASRFDAIVSSEDVTVGKPDPQVFSGRRLPARCSSAAMYCCRGRRRRPGGRSPRWYAEHRRSGRRGCAPGKRIYALACGSRRYGLRSLVGRKVTTLSR